MWLLNSSKTNKSILKLCFRGPISQNRLSLIIVVQLYYLNSFFFFSFFFFLKQGPGQLLAPKGPSNSIFGHIVLGYYYFIQHVLTRDTRQNISIQPLQHFLTHSSPPLDCHLPAALYMLWHQRSFHQKRLHKKSSGHNRGQLSRGIWIQHLAQQKEGEKRPTAMRVCPTNVSSGQSVHRVYPWVETSIYWEPPPELVQ